MRILFAALFIFPGAVFAAENFSVSGEDMVAAAGADPTHYAFAKRHAIDLKQVAEIKLDGTRIWIAGRELKHDGGTGRFVYGDRHFTRPNDQAKDRALENIYRQLTAKKAWSHPLLPYAEAEVRDWLSLRNVGLFIMTVAALAEAPAELFVIGGVTFVTGAYAEISGLKTEVRLVEKGSCDARGLHVQFAKGWINVKLSGDQTVAQVIGVNGEINPAASNLITKRFTAAGGPALLKRCAAAPVNPEALVASMNALLVKYAPDRGRGGTGGPSNPGGMKDGEGI